MTTSNAINRRFPTFILLSACLFSPISSFALPCIGLLCPPLPTIPIEWNGYVYREFNTLIGSGSINQVNAATDRYTIICPNGTTYLTALVKDDLPVQLAKLSIQLSKIAPVTPQRPKPPLVFSPLKEDYLPIETNRNLGDGDGRYSQPTSLSMGSGEYKLNINKTGIGSENYTFIYRCFTDSKQEIPMASLFITQDQ